MGNKKKIGTYFKDQMTEMDIRPKDSVWEEIEKTLKKKRRYRLFLFFTLFLLIFPTGVYFGWKALYNETGEIPQEQIDSHHFKDKHYDQETNGQTTLKQPPFATPHKTISNDKKDTVEQHQFSRKPKSSLNSDKTANTSNSKTQRTAVSQPSDLKDSIVPKQQSESIAIKQEENDTAEGNDPLIPESSKGTNELTRTHAQKEILKTVPEKDTSVARNTIAVKPKTNLTPQKESEKELARTLAQKEILKTAQEKNA
ncbi:MAG: hypothetical protein WBG90_02620, partial [Saonia sp.]